MARVSCIQPLAGLLAAAAAFIPHAAHAQARPDLVVEGLSLYAPMATGTGPRRVTVSFRVVNRGDAPAAASTARVSTTTAQPPSGPPGGPFGGVVGPRPQAADPQLGGGRDVRPTIKSPQVFATLSANDLATPALQPGETAWFSRTLSTAQADIAFVAAADADGQVSESIETNNAASSRFIAGSGSTGRWRPVGPSVMARVSGEPVGSGRITAIAIDPRTPATIYLGARYTGVWKTTDGGSNWEPLTDAMPTTSVANIAIDPQNPDRVFFVGQMGVFESVDGGHAWAQRFRGDLRPTGAEGAAMIVHATDAQRLYLATRNGLRISTDGGTTWPLVPLGGSAKIESFLQGAGPNNFFATVVDAKSGAPAAAFGIYETSDGGLTAQSWRKLSGCPGAALPAIGFETGVWFARSGETQWVAILNDSNGAARHEIWRSTRRGCLGGISTSIALRIQPGIGAVETALSERVWERVSLSTKEAPAACIGTPQNSRWSYLAADPTDANILFKAGIDLCRSTDGGRTFSVVAGPHVDHHAIAFHSGAPASVFIGNDGGFYRSDDRGATFQFRSEGLQAAEMLDLDIGGEPPLSVIAGTQDNGYSTTDLSNPKWIHRGGGDVSLVAIDPLHRATQYNVGQAMHQLVRTGAPLSDPFDNAGLPEGCLSYSENGQTFGQFIATTSAQWRFLATMSGPTDKGCDGALWTGPPWRSLFRPSDGEGFVRVLHDSLNGLFLAGGDRGSIYINFSPDAMAKVWQANGSVTAIVRNMARDGSYFVSLNAPTQPGRVFEIHSVAPLRFEGTDLTANLPRGLVMTLASNRYEPDVLYAGTSGGGVWRAAKSANGSWSWTEFNNGMPAGAIVTRLKVDQNYGLIHASTYGRGAFVLDTVSVF